MDVTKIVNFICNSASLGGTLVYCTRIGLSLNGAVDQKSVPTDMMGDMWHEGLNKCSDYLSEIPAFLTVFPSDWTNVDLN